MLETAFIRHIILQRQSLKSFQNQDTEAVANEQNTTQLMYNTQSGTGNNNASTIQHHLSCSVQIYTLVTLKTSLNVERDQQGT